MIAATARCTHAWSISRDILGHCSCDVGYCSCDTPEPGAVATAYDLSTDVAYACYSVFIFTFYVGLPLLALAGALRISWPWISDGGRKFKMLLTHA
jgi:hypothetical protein